MTYCVAVTFRFEPDARESFIRHVLIQAEESLKEPGCLVFDVWCDGENANEVFLYEVYDDRAAFDAHLASDHFHAFDATVAPLLSAKTVQTWDSRL
ncbi:putative quinol monooxygenase [Amorphus coralli]|uniref:putative quinol monooxygenase n=1 Tax=Amorphus coralli TaxID=340680 RepID=UPI00036649B9|nr:putative quinol monooxygenase [Amorphus coralli]